MNIEKKMVKIARMYYEMGKTQKEIADSENLSRSKVSRLLSQAKKEGIIKVTVDYKLQSVYDLEKKFLEKFDLDKIFITQVLIDNEKMIKKDVGKAVGEYLHEVVSDDQSIGVSWGNTMFYVANNLPDMKYKGIKIIQLNGGIAQSKFSTSSNTVIKRFVQSFKGDPYFLSVPSIVDNKNIADTILSDSNVKSNLNLTKDAEIAVFGIGYASKNSVLYKAGYFSQERFQKLKDNGAVGDICSRYFDIEGEICDQELNDRTIGVSLDNIKNKKYSIAVAAGKNKVKPIIGALKGGYCNTLFTDENTAKEILEFVD